MTAPLARALMRSRNPRDRALGRQLARNRRQHPGLPPELQRALDAANSIIKRSSQQSTPTPATQIIYRDASAGEGAATSQDMGFTPTYGSVPQARRRLLRERRGG